MEHKIGVIGLWHLGCVISASWVKLGYSVIGFDYDFERVRKLNEGIPPIFEPNLKETIEQGLKDKLLSFSNNITSLSACDFIFLSYDTPVRDDDSSDTSILEKSVRDVRSVMKHESVLIISSQSPAGFCSILRNILKESNDSLELAYSPENLRLGEAIECYLKPGRIILGTASNVAEQKCINLFKNITNEIISMNLESAEMVKHGINSFLAMSIVFANSMSDICEIKNARIDDVIQGMKSDTRIGDRAYLSPGIGFSGGTLGRDLKVLNEANENSNGFAKLFGFIHRSNIERKDEIVKKIKNVLGDLNHKTIGVLGLTYKPGTSTLRRSLPLEIVDSLIKEGSNIKVFDPKADYSELTFTPKFSIKESIEEVSFNADLILILTEWQQFKEFDWSKIFNQPNRNIIFDAKNCLNEKQIKNTGFQYYSIGRS